MENVNLESESRSELNSNAMAGESEARRRVMTEGGTFEPMNSAVLISGENGDRRDALYQAVMALSRSIAGRHGPEKSALGGSRISSPNCCVRSCRAGST